MTSTHLSDDESRRAVETAAAAATVLPASEQLTVGTPEPGSDRVLSGFAGAVVADLDAPMTGRIAVLVGADLVDALARSPLGGLDLAAALQPTLDAAAGALGSGTGAARQVGLELVVSDLGGAFTAVPLVGNTPTAVILVPDAVLRSAGRPADETGGPAAVAGLRSMPADEAAPARAVTEGRSRGIELLHGVDMEVTVEIGRTRMTVRELLDLAPGAVLELDRAAGSPADLLVNGRLIARGEVVVIDEDFGLRITEIVIDAAAS